MENNKKTEYRAPALEKGLEILELLASHEEPLTKKQIADKLNRSINEIFRMLSVLIEKQYIEFNDDSSSYSLTLKMFALSNQHPPISQLLKRATPLMEQLCYKVNQSCHLSRYNNGEMVVIARQESPYKMGFGLRLGSRIDVCSSGSGIVLISFSSEQQRAEILSKAVATKEEISHALSHVEDTLTNGFYVGASPQISGVTNISAPIFGVQGDIFAVITIPFMTLNSRTVHHHIEDIENTRIELLKVAKQLSQNLIS
ncbi:IclR family transcriptional regulator [Vibrio aestuarianus]|uniref:IclR family transcriptional regulator n=1 Tax=Vibrio aestuarianus TaxID=28171 RepID=UPI001558FB83|nr:IclR family transcriptional regulator [Vibrio aestuarianus]MDE1248381.1 IclR family transcriptional regulator [Vibrio aestuarianus]MDE1326189.1 IclR family transcriptional regulator [Vibrio aestuarianus]NGZ15190.1 IclR family transcriptional regulator [Vibrio aestuarianus]NKZ51338.1 IclR family transcriptional regulator [Vibrio aestuarianus]